MRVEYLLRPEAVECAPTDTLLAVARRMCAHQVSALAVVDEVGLVGMISVHDLVRAMAEDADPAATRVHEHSAPVRDIAVPAEDTWCVMRRMLDNGLEHIPVLHGTSVVNVVPLRHLVALEPSVGHSAAGSISDPTPPDPVTRDHPAGRHQSRHAGPAANHEPAHLGDAGWWLERADPAGAATGTQTPGGPADSDEASRLIQSGRAVRATA